MAPRIEPVDVASNTDPELVALLAKALLRDDGQPINIFGTLAHHPKLLDRFNRFGGFLLNRGEVPAREREIVILRVGWRSQSVYEFGQHTIIGERAGLTADEVAALTKDVADHRWAPGDLALIGLADELCANNKVGDSTWQQLAARWNSTELVELVICAGFYRLVSGFLNTIGVELDPGVPGWPT